MNHIIQAPNLVGIPHGFTTRKDPSGARDHFSFKGAQANENIQLLESHFPGFVLSLVHQTHSTDFVWVTKALRGLEVPKVDAQITKTKNILLATMVADCAPILLYCPKDDIVCAIHSGWVGSLGGIVANVLNELQQHHGVNHQDTRVAIGPHISPPFYEFQGRELDQWQEKFPASVLEYDGKFCIDIAKKIITDCESFGVQDIWHSDHCTFRETDKFFSHRKERDQAGRQIGFIGLSR